VGAAAAAGVAGAAVAKPSSKPATTIVKTGTTKVGAAPAMKAAVPGSTGPVSAVPVPAMAYQEEGSTTLTTIGAGSLAVVTWGTAIALALNYLGYI
jgi:hypothetical protein